MKQKGFTLIELLVVIAIIGILAVVVFVNLTSARQKSRDARRVADVNQARKALELYYNDCGQYPSDLDPATADAGCPAGTTVGEYLPTPPVDPQTGAAYPYTYIDDTTFTLDFTLEGQVDTYAAGNHSMTQDGIQ